VAIKEIGLEVNADKTKYMVMVRDQNAGRCHNKKSNDSFFERVEDSNIWEQPLQIRTVFRKKLKADRIQGMLAFIRCKIFCLPGCYLKIQ